LCLVPHCGRRRHTNPHMRAFWAATLAFMFAFVGWFAFAPLMTVVRVDLGLCDNDAEIQFLPEDERVEACVCKAACKRTIGNANIAAVSFDIFVRFFMGSVIEFLGPVKADCLLLSLGAVVVGASATITDGAGLIAARFFVSCLGSTFVVNQFWNSIMFSKKVVGTANATAGGWGNLGGGLTQTVMPLIFRLFKDGLGLSLSWSWRFSMGVPAALYVVLAVWIYFCAQDTAEGKFDIAIFGRKNKAGFRDYVRVVADRRVFLMMWQYSACFGCELVLNNVLTMHFHDVFGLDLVVSGALAMCFGGMNLFARSLGGIASDRMNERFGMSGRIWIHFISLLGQAVFLFAFGFIDASAGGWQMALAVLCVLATFVNMAEGTSYAIVPDILPDDLPVVSAVVGAGGTLGAVVATWSFYKYIEDPLVPFRLHAGYVLFWALTVLALRFPANAAAATRPAEVDTQQDAVDGCPSPSSVPPVLLGRTGKSNHGANKGGSNEDGNTQTVITESV